MSSNSLILSSLSLPTSTTTRGQSVKLSYCAKTGSLSYAANRLAVVRSLDSSSPSRTFSSSHPVTVAALSPSGFLIAVGDKVGNLKVIDFSGEEDRIKLEVKLGGEIRDIAWDGESARLSIVGEGREKFGAVYSISTGTSIGEILGHSKSIGAVAMRSTRPFRMITGSDDASVVFLNGPPFKFASISRNHVRGINSVAYSPDGTLAVSAGDGVHVYEGTEGTLLRSFTSIHTGSIYAVSFSPDSKRIATSSADGTTKLIDVSTGQILFTWKFEDQQVGNCWKGDDIVSLAFSGDLSILRSEIEKPVQIIYGHQKPLTALARSSKSPVYYTGDSAGQICSWDNGVCSLIGSSHSNLVISAIHDSDRLITIGMDDELRIRRDDGEIKTLSLGSLPKGQSLFSSNGLLCVVTAQDLQLINTDTPEKIFALPLSYSSTSVAVSANDVVAVGSEDGKVYLYASDGKSFNQTTVLEKNRSSVTTMRFTSDGKLLAVGEQSGKILVFDAETLEIKTSRFVNHSARIASLAWHKDNIRLVSGSLDSGLFIFSLSTPSKVLSAKNAHNGGVCEVMWASDDEVASAGADGTWKTWKLPI